MILKDWEFEKACSLGSPWEQSDLFSLSKQEYFRNMLRDLWDGKSELFNLEFDQSKPFYSLRYEVVRGDGTPLDRIEQAALYLYYGCEGNKSTVRLPLSLDYSPEWDSPRVQNNNLFSAGERVKQMEFDFLIWLYYSA